jgi:hypothetical protein
MPSQAITDLHLEDLPNIRPLDLTKLKRIGIDSVLELATSIPSDLAEETGVCPDTLLPVRMYGFHHRSTIW